MKETSLPIPLARAALILTPPVLLARIVTGAVRRMERRRPKLFKNLARLTPARVHFEPTDLPHRFGLVLGREGADFYLVRGEDEKPDARVAGSLQALIAMLEGREDGDALFFARDIQVTGDTTVIVGLRNTLDREEIDLAEEIFGLFGPFAREASLAAGVLDSFARRARARFAPRTVEPRTAAPRGEKAGP